MLNLFRRVLRLNLWVFVALSVPVMVSGDFAQAEDPDHSVTAQPVAQAQALENPTGAITLADALALAIRQNLDLAVFPWDIRAAEARELQAGLRPNPEITFEAEDIGFGGGENNSASRQSISLAGPELEWTKENGSGSTFQEAELTLSLSQLIELGGKRAHRIRVAQREQEVATWDYEVARADVLARTAGAFYAVLAAQDQVHLAEMLLLISQTVVETVATMVDAGKAPGIEHTRAEGEHALVNTGLERSRRQLDAARVQLAACWGASVAVFQEAAGSLDDVHSIPTLEELEAQGASLPDVSRWRAEVAMREAAVELERANAKPDVTVTFGLRTTGNDAAGGEKGYGLSAADGLSIARTRSSRGSDREQSVVLGFSLPLAVKNRNQGRVLEAEHLTEKAQAQRRAVEHQIRSTLAARYHLLQATQAEWQGLKSEVLPRAVETFEATNEGYLQGKFGLMDVLLARRTLFDTETRLLELQAEFHQNAVELERLAGQSLHGVAGSGGEATR